jgi:hypothetical protein
MTECDSLDITILNELNRMTLDDVCAGQVETSATWEHEELAQV